MNDSVDLVVLPLVNACIFCDGETRTAFALWDGERYRRCRCCSSLQIEKRPQIETTKKHYEVGYDNCCRRRHRCTLREGNLFRCVRNAWRNVEVRGGIWCVESLARI